MAFDHTMLDEASTWAVRTSEPEFDDWAAFTSWLEASPDHAKAYDHVMIAVEDGAATLNAAPANDEGDVKDRSVRRWIVPAIAACLALVAAFWVWQMDGAASPYRTDPGETRRIAFADGSGIVMGGDTELFVDPENPRYARLERGRALFEIRHDEFDPFRVDVGAATLVDAGTVFDVNIGPDEVEVGVSEGAVIFNPSQQNATVQPGQLLTFSADGTGYGVSELPIEQVGEWREGRLTFDDASLTKVAADISRVSGIDYRAAKAGGTNRISGSITVQSLRADPSSLGLLLGLEVERSGTAWILSTP
ncbi:FecR domain-containing protein [Qipengyuania sp. GH25]|uniref:FecR domain-containing protein n=1 Tax=Qipengyuania pacifica TaxID=2860199 RepID=A0ABS7JKC9_9SPHN|nr:FecR domain-containing protein [Qipengyuania aerophila]MBX7489847.1 FecR domain-containing protein [Qipengyuania aerophila]